LAQSQRGVVKIGFGHFALGDQPQQVDHAGRHLPDFIAQHRQQFAHAHFVRTTFPFCAADAADFDIKRCMRLESDGEIRPALFGSSVFFVFKREAIFVQECGGGFQFGADIQQAALIAGASELGANLAAVSDGKCLITP
jgi:hypothetical protein